MTEETTVNSNQGLVLYYLARTREEQLTRKGLDPAALARHELRATRNSGRPRTPRWWSR